MKKWVRKAMAVALSGALLLGASGMALGAASQKPDSKFNDSTSADTANAADNTDYFYLIKNYDAVNTSTTSPADTFTYTITPYGVWNADSAYTSGLVSSTSANIPMLQRDSGTVETGVTYDDTATPGTLVVNQAVDAGRAGNSTDRKAKVVLPTTYVAGDYWYQVVETTGSTAGVEYGTNASGSATYYIHVQVTQGASGLVKNVTMHKSQPTGATSAAYNTNSTTNHAAADKVNDITNTYSAGTLSITKEVTGNAGDKSEYFQVQVVFTEPTDGTNYKTVKSDILFEAYNQNKDSSHTEFVIRGSGSSETYPLTSLSGNRTEKAWSSHTATATFWIKDTETVTFTNIPYGVTYTVQEILNTDEGYQNSLAFTTTKTGTDNDTASSTLSTTTNRTASGDIDDPSDAITITNEKNVVIDIGVITEDAPYVALMAVCAGAAVLMVTRKKRIFED